MRARSSAPVHLTMGFCERVDSRAVDKKAIEALIKCGALGSTGASRKGMLAVLETAQAAGQKAQQDALVGQGSIFDLDPPAASTSGGAGGWRRGRGLLRPSNPPIPAEEFDQPQLLAVEKEAIGLFISAHPLKPMREALQRARGLLACRLANRRDKDWVTVGGIITESKKIRTRNGDHMMFATLDDLEGAVEILVFGKALAEQEAWRGKRARGRPGGARTEAASTTRRPARPVSSSRSVERFTPTEQEVERADSEAKAISCRARRGGAAGAPTGRRRSSAGERDRGRQGHHRDQSRTSRGGAGDADERRDAHPAPR